MHVSKLGRMSEYMPIGNYMKAKTVSIKDIDEYQSAIHYGVFVLDASKYKMNTLFDRLGWDIIYTDTDSAVIYNGQYDSISSGELIGKNLGQFKADFDDKFVSLCKKNDIVICKKGKSRLVSFIEEYGVVSILGIYNAKKQYCNVLMGLAGTEDETYITCTFQTTAKGMLHSDMTVENYNTINEGGSFKQARTNLFNLDMKNRVISKGEEKI